jgi:two-component system NtrC family sensor kinase
MSLPVLILLLAVLVLGVTLLLARRRAREHARANAAIVAARETIARAERLATTGRLAAGIAHEVGNPLAAIVTYANVLRLRAGESAALTEPIDALEREVARIDRIVRGLLDYARPRRATPLAVPVDALLADVVQLLRDQGHLRRVDVRVDVEAGAGGVRADRHDLHQAFVNLLLNAVEAMEGVGALAVRARAMPAATLAAADAPSARALARIAPARRLLRVEVADSGPGVPPEDAERIFEPFFSTKLPGRGTGLGLAIVAQTIEALGGAVWVQPSREGGAAFVLLLPLEPDGGLTTGG